VIVTVRGILMKIGDKATSLLDLEVPALTAYHNANALLMALEGTGKHAIEEGHEVRALTELALAIRNATADILKTCGLFE
jgi:hypothetical protein